MRLRGLAAVAVVVLVGCGRASVLAPAGSDSSGSTGTSSASSAGSAGSTGDVGSTGGEGSSGSTGSGGSTGGPSDLCLPCEDSTDCEATSTCVDGFCAPACNTDADCGAGNACVAFTCRPAAGGCSAPTASSTSGTSGSVSTASSSSGSSHGSSSGSSGSTGHASSSGGTSGSSGSSGSTGSGVGPNGGTVHLLKFGISGDTRPPRCGATADYPTPILTNIAKAEKAAGAQFALDLGDHMFVCDNDFQVAKKQMSLFMKGVAHFGKTWFLTEGNHECMGSGHGSCPTGSNNANFRAFLDALSPISSTPYYSVDVQTSQGLATFVYIADNSWDANQEAWLKHTLTVADRKAKYTIIAKHHPPGNTSVQGTAAIMRIVRNHKFALILTGHAHYYDHLSADGGRDLILGIGGAPLTNGASYHGYGIVEQRPNGRLRVSIYDVNTGTLHDRWSVGPNPP